MSNDRTFFTNEKHATLVDRFKSTLKDVEYFDVLVGYFRSSGFRLLYDALETVDHIRILVGLNVDQKTYQVLEQQRMQLRGQMVLDFDRDVRTAQETKAEFSKAVSAEMETSPDTHDTEIGVRKFIEFLQSGKLKIKAHPTEKIHAKVYIQRFQEDDRDFGRVITGSSNFSYSGLLGNYEFNVELKNSADVEFALEKFEELWADAVDVSEAYQEAVQRDTWLSDSVTPWQLYLKLLYEYFQEEINVDDELNFYLPDGFLSLDYQKDAVINALRILNMYGGVFIADVVGLGKTYISALLAQNLPGRKLVICPPVLADYWRETFHDFGVRSFRVESMGKLDHILRGDVSRYQYVFIDEAHRFRNEQTQNYEKLAQICAGKKVILVSATPFNNTIEDIFSQLKLFQPPRNSIIPGVRNIEAFFADRVRRIRQFERTDPEYLPTIKRVAAEVRDSILTHVMVRRTRNQISKNYQKDIEQQGLFFPKMADPRRLIYEFDAPTAVIFNATIERLQAFHYTRYTPLLYLRDGISGQLQQGQRNVGAFMRMMLVKRLESSFFAFRQTLRRFIKSYESFMRMVDEGTVYIGDAKILDLFEQDDEARLIQLVEEGDAEVYDSDLFVPELMDNLLTDLELLIEVQELWEKVYDDPKLERLIDALWGDEVLGQEKVIVFTESAETAHYLFKHINAQFPNTAIAYTSGGGVTAGQTLGKDRAKEMILANYDPRVTVNRSDQIRILITTDVLAEGINLHRSPVVVNYDLPWNPTRVLQRVGRVNRVGTEHPLIYIYNFFPTDQSDEHLNLEANVIAKIQAFHNMLGEDSRYLSENEEVIDHDALGERLYQRLNRRDTYNNDDEDERSELEYLRLIRRIRDEEPELFAQIKRLPKKARAGWATVPLGTPHTLTFFRQGRIKKFFMANGGSSQELTFFHALDLVACDPDTLPVKTIPPDFYEQLGLNKGTFQQALAADEQDTHAGGSGYERRLRAYVRQLRKMKGLTDTDEEYIDLLGQAFEDGKLPQQTLRRTWQAISKAKGATKAQTGLRLLRDNIPYALLLPLPQSTVDVDAPREIILSAYLI
ncbi:MAG: helicase-related protein [Candidatus Promineifilaceae bacterium]